MTFSFLLRVWMVMIVHFTQIAILLSWLRHSHSELAFEVFVIPCSILSIQVAEHVFDAEILNRLWSKK